MDASQSRARVETALAALVLCAGASADDASEHAAQSVCRVLEVAGCAVARGEASSPAACPLARFLQAATGIAGTPYSGEPFLLVTTFSVVLFGARVSGRAGQQRVDLPAVVRHAIALVARNRAKGLIKEVA